MDLKQKWTPPDRLRTSLPRPVQLARQGIAFSFVAGLLIVGAFLAGIFLARTVRREQQEQRLLDQQGITGDAVITRIWRTNDKSPEPRVTYRFQYQGSVLSHSVNAPLAQWRELKAGAPLAIRFVPSRPEISHPIDWPWRGMPAWLPYVITGFLAGIASIFLVRIGRQFHLLAEGRPAPGRVTGVRRRKTLTVLYEFQLPDGTTLKGSACASKTPEVGQQVCVLYDSESPRRNALYPLPLVRLQ